MSEISPWLPELLLALTAVMIGLMSPGPNILAVIGTSMGVGRKKGTALALGVAFGSFVWAAIAVTGLTALLARYGNLLVLIKVIGGCYLLWLGFKALRSAATRKEVVTAELAGEQSLVRYFLRGLTVQMTNPKAAFTMTAIVTIGIQGDTPVTVKLFLVAGISILSLFGHLGYAWLFSTRSVVSIYLRARRLIEAMLGVLFCAAGFKLLSEKT